MSATMKQFAINCPASMNRRGPKSTFISLCRRRAFEYVAVHRVDRMFREELSPVTE